MIKKIVSIALSFVMILSISLPVHATEEAVQAEESTETVEWLPEDFEYTYYEKTMYGCDYSRQFVVKGQAIAGFSESGFEKLEKSKDLVLPSTDTEGNKLVAVADNAFKEMGLTSVTFPTGMMVDYDDTVTNVVTKRGNFIIGSAAFMKNELTNVYLPEGVIAVLPNAFQNNKIEKVTLPHTIWWLETLSFAGNQLTNVGFPKTCDFQLEIHGMAFVNNNIRWVRLPDYVEVVYKHAFYFNPGMEDCPEDAPDDEKEKGGVVYMYTDNAALLEKNRVHHIEKSASTQFSWHQKLIVEPAPEGDWTVNDFTYDGTTITGFSDSGLAKRGTYSELELPDKNPDGEWIKAIASSSAGGCGLFATDEIKFDTLTLPARVEKIGDYAFQNNGLNEIREFPNSLKEIGSVAFQTNDLRCVILPDSVTTVGTGAFATNPLLESIVLSKSLTEISDSVFGCSDKYHYMTKLTELSLHDGLTKIGARAFAGNNIKNIVIPETVNEIGRYAFSTKNYLKDECTLTLPEGLTTIGEYAFRNKVIKSVSLPSTVTKLYDNTFLKEYSTDEEVVITTVYLSKEQMEDTENFPASSYHTYKLKSDENDTEWTKYDFTYGEISIDICSESDSTSVTTYSGIGITGLTESGLSKVTRNPHIIIPEMDTNGNTVVGIAAEAFSAIEQIESVTFPETIKDYIILDNAFYNNNLSTIDLSGVIYVGKNAFANNALINILMDENIWKIDAGAFSDNKLQSVSFPEHTQNPLMLESKSFSGNTLKAIQIPDNTEKIAWDSFVHNTGMESVSTDAPSDMQNGGVVYLYVNNEQILDSVYIQHTEGEGDGTSESGTKSWVQKIIFGDMSVELTPWNISDFTVEGTTITGLSDSGQAKRSEYPNMIMPDTTADGLLITEIADGPASEFGLFAAEGELLNKVILPKGLIKIGDNAFRAAGVTSVEFPSTLTSIGTSAFQMCQLEEIILPDSVTTVGTGAFASNDNLKNVKLSNQMTEIPDAMFLDNNGNENFTSIEIPDGIVRIGARAFSGNGFTKLVIPDTVKEIGDYAFGQTDTISSLTEVVLPHGLEIIGNDAFRNTQIETMELPATVISLGKDAFRLSKGVDGIVQLYTNNMDQLNDNTEASYYANGSYHKVIYSNLVGTGWTFDDFLFEGSTLTGWSEKGNETRLNVKSLVLPEKNPETGEIITAIGNNAFAIPDSETEQTKTGVDSPNGMTSVIIPPEVTMIGDSAFIYNNLTTVSLPEGLTTIGTTAFKGNKLIKVVLPDTVTTVKEGAFATNDISELKLSKGITKIETGTFSMNIHLDQIELHEGLTEIGDTAFAGARLTTLDIPSTVTKVGRKAFHLHHLSELHVPGNVEEIGESAFEGTPKGITMLQLTLGDGIKTIGSRAFAYGYLESVELPESLESLAADAFVENSGINNDHIVLCYLKYTDKTAELLNNLELEGARFVTEPRRLEVVNAELSDGVNDVKISWNAPAYISGVKIYHKKTSDTEWSDALNVTESEYIFNDLQDDSSYDFKVIPYCEANGKIYMDETQATIVSITTLCDIPAPGNLKAMLSGRYDTVALSWNESSGAIGYNIYYKKGTTDTFTYLASTQDTSYSKDSLSDGVKYTFKVVPYYVKNDNKLEGDNTSTVSIYTLKKLAAPTITLSTSSKVKVAWNNISGESGYQISRSTSKTGTNIISTYGTTSGKSKVFTTTKDKTYYYKVRAYVKVGDKKIYGPWSNVTSFKLRKVSAASGVTTVLYGYDDVKVSWKKVSGANSYYIYYKKASADSYTYLGKTSNAYYKKANLSDGIKYTFKVVPCYVSNNKKTGQGTSKTASIYTLKKLNTPTVKKSSSTKVKVSWNNISGESGYQISASTSKTKTNIVKTYSTTSGKSATVTVKKGKTYYYKVRAYKTVSGKKIYGPWSAIKSYKNK